MTETPPRYDGQPVRPVPIHDDAERRQKALEQLRRNLRSAVKQVEDLLELEQRKANAA